MMISYHNFSWLVLMLKQRNFMHHHSERHADVNDMQPCHLSGRLLSFKSPTDTTLKIETLDHIAATTDQFPSQLLPEQPGHPLFLRVEV